MIIAVCPTGAKAVVLVLLLTLMFLKGKCVSTCSLGYVISHETYMCNSVIKERYSPLHVPSSTRPGQLHF